MSNAFPLPVISRRAFGRACAGVALAASAPKALAGAASRSVAELADYAGPDRRQVLEAGARNEGRLLLYTTGTQIEPLIRAFERKYPFIEVSLNRGTQADITRQTVEEYRAGYHKVDMFELASDGLAVIRDRNILQPFRSPEAAAYDTAAIEAARHWVIVRESYTGVGFNTRLVPSDKAPKTYDDLLAPEWRGRMAITGSISTASNWVGNLLVQKGEAFVRALGRQNIRIYNMTSRALANLMIAGEVAVSPTIYNSHVAESSARGAPIAWNAPGPVPVVDTAVAIATRAASPHAALLMIDHLASREGQELYRGLGYASARRDVAAAVMGVQKAYLGNRPNYVREFAEWSRLYQGVFLRPRL